MDKDGSGEIGFHEFLAILQPKGATAGKSAIDKITHLQDVKKVGRGKDARRSPAHTDVLAPCVLCDLV